MTYLEQQVLTQVKAIIGNEEQVIGRRGILIPLKKALINEADIRVLIDIVSSDPALAAHLLWRSNTAQAGGIISTKNRSIKDALIRLGQVNIYRYAFSFYLKERLDELKEPYSKLVKGYWALTESIAVDAVQHLRDIEESDQPIDIDADEVQTLALFSVFGQVITLSAFAFLNAASEKAISLQVIKTLIDTQQQSLSIEAFEALGLDDDLRNEFMIAHNIKQTDNANSAGMVLRHVLAKRNVLINPLSDIDS
ncbi:MULTISPECIES: HDOD domain-containing protein [Shewanella]|uniref:HDOD domain-containing protein n=1 Tax=Shewanella TaxID=22 RepID=UPI0006D653DD|nr:MULTISPECIES: HDOD domain-containing protein [Shewanella]KPZ67871.1 HDOD domain protein [Shewanella sp. P1-14-1]MBQ4889739.1 HDOD domain-containing protein [Shewanella sp. MMG014]OBT10664.1 histidine kinase [Shewanella sp. UCD-FRSSP16_17]